MRIDKYLAIKGLAKSRESAQRLIEAGLVTVGGSFVKKPSFEISEDSPPEIKITGETIRYVSRGGLKLESALDAFKIGVEGLDAVDIGASTGGFTDCLLKNGAARVRAVDVGRSQLDPKLAADPRVISFEGMNARYLTPDDIGGECDIVVCDVSFISLGLIIPAVKRILKPEGKFIALIKPQFEAGKANIGKNGIVRDRNIHVEVILLIIEEAQLNSLYCFGIAPSPITGGDGNREYVSAFNTVLNGTGIDREYVKRIVFGE
jgi:23S rRNA (cytidine1920-2'-O)/16S rRNA (cytidine1409-2'-O)-methyltransferase